MAYKVKHRNHPEKYWRERDIMLLREKYKGHIPPATQIYRASARWTLHIQEDLHRKGTFVEYKDRVGRIEKVTDKGIWVELLSKPTDKSIAYPEKKVFVTEKEIDEGKIYPTTFAETPLWMATTYFETPKFKK